MRNKDILDALGGISPKKIEACERSGATKRGKTLRVLLVAAAVLLLVSAVVAGTALARKSAGIPPETPNGATDARAADQPTAAPADSAGTAEKPSSGPVKRAPQKIVNDQESGLIFALNDKEDAYTVIGICDRERTEIVIPDSYDDIPITTLAKENLLEGTDVALLVVSKNVDTIYAPAFFSDKPLAIAVNNENPYFYCAGNCLIDRRNDALVRGFAFSEIPTDGSVKRIAAHAFERCPDLTEIIVPESVKVIECQAFGKCTSLVSVTLPAGLEEIGGTAFSGCTALKSIELPAGLKTLDWGAFSGCTALEECVLPDKLDKVSNLLFCDCTNLKKVTLGAGVKTIEGAAFAGCKSLKEILLNDGLEYISHQPFSGCDALVSLCLPASLKKLNYTSLAFILADVRYEGTVDDWAKIEKVVPKGAKTKNGILVDFEVLHCSDGDIRAVDYHI